MSIKQFGAKLFARYIVKKTQKWVANPYDSQRKILDQLIQKGKTTQFGKIMIFKISAT